MPARRGSFLVLALSWLAGCGGHVIRPELAPNWRRFGQFDFERPPCRISPKPQPAADRVAVRYLGLGGLYVEWQGSGLLMAPFFSNPGLFQVPRGRLVSKAAAVERGLNGMDLSRVRAIAVGHSHYDHLGDLPLVTEKFTPRARVYVNRTGAHALAPIPHLKGRISVLEDEKGWISLRDEQGNQIPIRLRAVPSKHAPHFYGLLLAGGDIGQDWTGPWDQHRLLALRTGQTYAFVIDLLSPDFQKVRFRIYYQDSANPRRQGVPTLDAGDERPYDLAVLCMASFQFVRKHPGAILGHLKPQHVLVTHYEDFFRGPDKRFRFVLFLTDFWANRFLYRTRRAVRDLETLGPEGTVCGPSSSGWTMPMPGEWMRFRVSLSGAAGS